MFGRKNKGKGKGKATASTTATPRAFEVWYKDSIGRWVHGSTHTVRSDANAAVRAFTIAVAEVREVY